MESINSTGIHKQIPASPISNSSYENIFTFIYGFAYDSSTDDYLVVLGSFKHDGDWEPVSSSIDLEIFSVRANKWKQIMSDSHLPYMRTCQLESGIERVGLFLNGALHWLVWNHETGDDVIIAFDVKEMRMSEIALPDDFYISVSPTEHDLMVHGGLICVWMIDIDVVKIWVMKEYTVHSSWTKIIEFSTHHEPYFLICFTNCGDIVGSDFQGALLKFNDKGQMLEHHSYDHHRRYPQRSQMAMYTESLLSLPGGTEQA